MNFLEICLIIFAFSTHVLTLNADITPELSTGSRTGEFQNVSLDTSRNSNGLATNEVGNDRDLIVSLQENYRTFVLESAHQFRLINSTVQKLHSRLKVLETAFNDHQQTKTQRLQTSKSIYDINLEIDELSSRVEYLERRSKNHTLRAILYEHQNFHGKKIRVDNEDGKTCFNLDFYSRVYSSHNLDRMMSSIETEGNCVRLYKSKGCMGTYLEVGPKLRVDCQQYLGHCDYNDATSSISFCNAQLPPENSMPTGSRGVACKDPCETSHNGGKDYFWCNLISGSWDYCSPRRGQDYHGDDCDGECGYRGEAYRWCYLKGQRHLDHDNDKWGYCS